MFMLVSLTKVKQALQIEHSDDDGMLEVWIGAASRAVHAYLKGQAGDLLSIESPADSPPNDLDAVDERIQAAVIILTGHFYRAPDWNPDEAFQQGYLPKPVTAILYSMRDPAVA